ncbi:MAG: GHKL domain-containing protein [Candidatus Cloacimonetes bacterium]|nr:GHKL domain-containing protein [Candidatus Cloacimonadota bacterium]
MKSRKTELEKRIFVLFFVITFFLVLTLIFIEWQLAKFGINQYEDMNIRLTLSELKIARNEMEMGKQNLLTNLEADKVVIDALQKGDKNLINNHLYQNYQSEDIDKLIICNKQREYIFGEQWELLDKYLSQIYRDISKENSGFFIGNFGSRLFQITYNPIFISNEIKELFGVLIIIENFDISNLKLSSEYEVSLISYDKTLSENAIPGNLTDYVSDINDLIESMTEKKLEQTIKKFNINNAAGIKIFYDLTNEPSGIFIISYIRFVNQFVQQSILIFVLILLAVTLFMISLLGNWFSKTILIPVRDISNKMQDISENPSKLEPIEIRYSGVLGDMVTSFNTMNIALSKHGQTLREYKELTDNLDTGIFWLNNNFEIILYNPSFVKIMEMSENQLNHQNLSKLLGLKEEQFAKLYDAPLTFSNLKVFPNKNQKYVALNIRAVKHDEITKFFGSIIDVSKEIRATEARKSLELELIKSNKLADIGKKIEGIVHNINSPLNTVLGYAQLLKKDMKDNADLDRIIEAGKNIAQTVKGLLTKVKQSNISIDRPIDINEMIAQELDFCKHNLFFKHYVTLTTDFQKNLPTVTASYGDLSLCTANIINNAIQAMKDCVQKELTIKTYEKEKMVFIEITDTGEGIPENNIGKIFETYFSTKIGKTGTGFGLGLAITKSIIEKYEGKIKVESKPDYGSTFTLILPQTKG